MKLKFERKGKLPFKAILNDPELATENRVTYGNMNHKTNHHGTKYKTPFYHKQKKIKVS